MSLTVLLPVMPGFLESLGGGSREVGYSLMAFSIGVLLARPMSAELMKKLTRRQMMIIAAVAITLLPWLYLWLPRTGSVILLRLFHGMGLGMFSMASQLMLSDLAPENKRGFIMGVMGVSFTIAMAAGPALGDYLWNSGHHAGTFHSAALLGLCAIISAVFLFDPAGEKPTPPSAMPMREVLAVKVLMIPSIALLFAAAAHGAVLSFLPMLLKAHAIPGLVSSFFIANAIGVLVSRFVMGRVSDRKGRLVVMLPGLIVQSAGIFLLTLTTTPPALWAAGLLVGLGFGAFVSVSAALVTDLTAPEIRPSAFSIYFASFDLGTMCAGLAAGVIAEWRGIDMTFIAAAISPLLALLAYLLFWERGMEKQVVGASAG
ncbi:MAG: hypothetical protein GMKNLPBB_02822 [Myxococcota bacterium]|nr:hypothetical protein [Myxococcota bacterium]